MPDANGIPFYDEPGIFYDDPCFLYDGYNICEHPLPVPTSSPPFYWRGRSSSSKKQERKIFTNLVLETKLLSVNQNTLNGKTSHQSYSGEDEDDIKVTGKILELNSTEENYEIKFSLLPEENKITFKTSFITESLKR